jgi:hypothetical protein
MERLGTFSDARAKVLSDIKRLLTRIQSVAGAPAETVDQGIAILKRLRAETYEDLNQIQHEYMILCAAEWLIGQKRCPANTVWSWNPRQTGGADEPDLRGELNGLTLLSAEITTSTEPKGMIDNRMRRTLEKLSNMAGRQFYFTASPPMCQRAQTKIRKAGWQIEAVCLPVVINNAL